MSENKGNKKSEEELVRLPYFDWDKLKHFYYIAKIGSFSEAGEFLNIAQSSLSRKIAILEGHLNFKLFTRLPRGVKLTRKGEELFKIIEKAFIDLKGFTYNSAVMASSKNEEKRRIRIATTYAFAAYIFTDLLVEYNKSHPNILFELIGEDHVLDILLNDVDLTIHPLVTSKNINNLLEIKGTQQEVLFSVYKQLYAGNEYLEKYGEPKSIEDLKYHRLLAFGHPERHPYGDVNWILELGMSEGKTHDPVFTSNSVECLINAAKQGLGIVSSYADYSIIKDSGLKNILPDIRGQELKEYIIYPEYLKEDKEILDLKDYLRRMLASRKL